MPWVDGATTGFHAPPPNLLEHVEAQGVVDFPPLYRFPPLPQPLILDLIWGFQRLTSFDLGTTSGGRGGRRGRPAPPCRQPPQEGEEGVHLLLHVVSRLGRQRSAYSFFSTPPSGLGGRGAPLPLCCHPPWEGEEGVPTSVGSMSIGGEEKGCSNGEPTTV
jgi:hypothetical protein